MADQEGTGQSNGFIVISNYKDVCKSPGAPIPYDIIAFLGHGAFTSGNTNFQGFPVFSMGSRVTQCFGDLPGVGLGIKSGAVGGWCRPITEVPTVICNGQKLCRHDHTLFEMNCLGPEGPGNTIGKVYYLGAMMCGPVAPGGKLGSQQNPPLQSSTKELGPLEKIWDSLKIKDIQDAVGLAQQAYALSNVDWSNPGAALGALSGMAGRAGLGDLQSALRIGQTAAKTDWSDPVAALKGAASIGGDTLSLGQSLYDMLPAAAPSPPPSGLPPGAGTPFAPPSNPDNKYFMQIMTKTASSVDGHDQMNPLTPGHAQIAIGIEDADRQMSRVETYGAEPRGGALDNLINKNTDNDPAYYPFGDGNDIRVNHPDDFPSTKTFPFQSTPAPISAQQYQSFLEHTQQFGDYQVGSSNCVDYAVDSYNNTMQASVYSPQKEYGIISSPRELGDDIVSSK